MRRSTDKCVAATRRHLRARRTAPAALALALGALAVCAGWAGALGTTTVRVSSTAPVSLFDSHGATVAHAGAAPQALVTWRGNTAGRLDILGRILNDDGSLGAERVLSNPTAGAYAESDPAVVHNGARNEYLVVWVGLDPSMGAEVREVLAQRVAADGSRIGGVIRVSNHPNPTGSGERAAARDPDVAYDSLRDQYLVVWERNMRHETDNEVLEIYAQRLDATGGQLGGDFRLSTMGPDSSPFQDGFDPAIAFNPSAGEFLVTWWGDDEPHDEFEVWAQRVSGDGNEVGPDDIRVTSVGAPGDLSVGARNPDVAWNGHLGEYLVAWETGFSLDDTPPEAHEKEIFVQRLSPVGGLLGTPVQLSATGAAGDVTRSAANATVAASTRGGEFIVAWQAEDAADGAFSIDVRRIGAGAVPLQGASALSAAEADRDAVLPAAAYGPSANEYLVAWVGDQRPLAAGAMQVHVRGTAAGAPTTISTTTPTSSPTGTPTPTATAIATPTPEPSLRDLTLALGGRRVQRTLDTGRLTITARCSVTCRLNATARVRVSTRTSFALKRIRATAGPDTRRRMSFTLSRRVRRAVRHALRQGRRVEARSRVRATDALGRSKNKRRTIRLRA